MIESVSLIPLVIAIAIYMAVGMFWYSPSAFGDMWCRAYGFDSESLSPSPFTYGGAIVNAGLLSWVLAMIIGAVNPSSFWEGLQIGFYCWLGFVVTTQFSGVLWGKKPITGFLIDIGGSLAGILAVSILLTLWR